MKAALRALAMLAAMVALCATAAIVAKLSWQYPNLAWTLAIAGPIAILAGWARAHEAIGERF